MLILLFPLALLPLVVAQSKPTIIDPRDLYLTKQYIDAITAYGPGVGVFAPYSYADFSYDNVPFIGKIIPVLGKEGTSSRLGISPFYPPGGNPSNPVPPLYRARPLPLHIPEPVDVVAVPLDEEALHGEPLFPKELVLPEFMEMAGKLPASSAESVETPEARPDSPFGSVDTAAFARAEKEVEQQKRRPVRRSGGNTVDSEEDMVLWPALSSMNFETGLEGNALHDDKLETIIDGVQERSTKMEEMLHEVQNEPIPMGDGRGRRRRIRRLAEILAQAL